MTSAERIEKAVQAIMDCEAAGPISRSAALVVAKSVLEAIAEPTRPDYSATNDAGNGGYEVQTGSRY